MATTATTAPAAAAPSVNDTPADAFLAHFREALREGAQAAEATVSRQLKVQLTGWLGVIGAHCAQKPPEERARFLVEALEARLASSAALGDEPAAVVGGGGFESMLHAVVARAGAAVVRSLRSSLDEMAHSMFEVCAASVGELFNATNAASQSAPHVGALQPLVMMRLPPLPPGIVPALSSELALPSTASSSSSSSSSSSAPLTTVHAPASHATAQQQAAPISAPSAAAAAPGLQVAAQATSVSGGKRRRGDDQVDGGRDCGPASSGATTSIDALLAQLQSLQSVTETLVRMSTFDKTIARLDRRIAALEARAKAAPVSTAGANGAPPRRPARARRHGRHLQPLPESRGGQRRYLQPLPEARGLQVRGQLPVPAREAPVGDWRERRAGRCQQPARGGGRGGRVGGGLWSSAGQPGRAGGLGRPSAGREGCPRGCEPGGPLTYIARCSRRASSLLPTGPRRARIHGAPAPARFAGDHGCPVRGGPGRGRAEARPQAVLWRLAGLRGPVALKLNCQQHRSTPPAAATS